MRPSGVYARGQLPRTQICSPAKFRSTISDPDRQAKIGDGGIIAHFMVLEVRIFIGPMLQRHEPPFGSVGSRFDSGLAPNLFGNLNTFGYLNTELLLHSGMRELLWKAKREFIL